VRHQQQIIDKGLAVNFETDDDYTINSNPYLVEIVLDNIISN
jgi:two-component system, OmpR family, heavy metal sensor histidine kinase CusS